MKFKFLILFFCAGLISFPALSQDSISHDKILVRVYSNFKKGILKDDLTSSFEIRRVYLGYKGKLDEHFSAEVKLDIGSPDDLSQYSLIRRYAYFKTASVSYQKNRIAAWFGLFDMQQFKLQENFWGYRYIYKSFQDEHKFGPSADIGAGIKYKICERISAELVFSNGEGNRNSFNNDFIKQGIGITLSPLKNFTFRMYYDYIFSVEPQSTISVFSGYQTTDYRIGAEYNFRKNHRFQLNQDLDGYSFYGTYIINDKWEIFGRYDILNSNLIPEQTIPWNIFNDGTSIITGCQFNPAQGLNVSLNYQDRYSRAKNGTDLAYIFLNVQFDL